MTKGAAKPLGRSTLRSLMDASDVYFLRARDALLREGVNPVATMEVWASRDGLLCGTDEVVRHLAMMLTRDDAVRARPEGYRFSEGEVVVQITAPYADYGFFETQILGILGSESGWATAAAECVAAAGGVPVISFGARHCHHLVAGYMDRAAVVGGCVGCSTTLGASLVGKEPSGTMPHAFILCLGDTVRAAEVFHRWMPPDVPRIVLVDTYRDEAEESVRVAQALDGALSGVRLDTPPTLGGVTPELVLRVRAALDERGFAHVKIIVSGGMNPGRIAELAATGKVDGFGVGTYIAGAAPIVFTADVHAVEGKPVGKRGRPVGPQAPPDLPAVPIK